MVLIREPLRGREKPGNVAAAEAEAGCRLDVVDHPLNVVAWKAAGLEERPAPEFRVAVAVDEDEVDVGMRAGDAVLEYASRLVENAAEQAATDQRIVDFSAGGRSPILGDDAGDFFR